MNVFSHIVLLFATIMSVNAIASGTIGKKSDNWDVDGLNGAIVANGMLVSSPCVLSDDSLEQELDLGAISQKELEKTDDVTVPVAIHIVMDDCPGGVHQLNDKQDMRRNLWLADQSVASMTIMGDEEPSDPRFFRLKGTTSGYSLRIEDAGGEQLMPSVAEHPIALSQGRNDLVFKAQLRRNDQPVSTGEWTAVIRVGMEYD
ncbi:fimbrial protein [Pantoea stewartii]|uniref:Fimbrial-type adhesion domain-containing protein n=1 Tax=Pantoea stewartii TaxID=66269 RepID=A0AB34VC57_9GAMM|nr:fimbrial protein [Pantoea stewartii]KTS71423.1 hypothetical protein RSA30_18125 [Pantoea stewartii]KTS94526.1 hypothetical protein RSA13_17675 [Pantoea stewartii]KTT08151.1 hypothetical protein RSA36_09625 [Pantoea stewartii]MDF7784168.1 fimbrial protein [Pantoea stewartii]MDK2633224.1 fimbrial protein [Pantoea stewartii subsp. indologenes]